MKIKNFVCNSSGINEIIHSVNIEEVPFVYKISENNHSKMTMN